MQALILVASLLGFIALTLGTALFVAAEFSLTALERSTVENDYRTRGDLRSKQVRKAHRTLSFQLSGAQLGITITTLVTGYIAEPVLAQLFAPAFDAAGLPDGVTSAISLILALVIATSLSMILGELIPKNLAIAKPLPTARATAGPMSLFSATFRWLINSLNGTANWIVRRVGVEPAEELRSARSPQELGSLVRNSARHGALDPGTAALVDRSLQFGERTAEDLMSPRVTVESLDVHDTVRDLIIASSRTGYSRFPILDGGDLDNIVGVVHVKQAFTVAMADRATTELGSLARDVPVVPASLDGDSLMEQIRADGLQVAVVVDEYGGTAGIVTTEDLIEEIVGDVTDEHDDEQADVQRDGDGYICNGLLRIDELHDAIGYRAPEGQFDTLGGLLMFELGRIAAEGDVVELPERVTASEEDDDRSNTEPEQRWQARVVRMEGRRIDVVALTPITDTGAEVSHG
ncbi:CBS domain containing-hemolysin-like protein [Williamsia limnetica]|jgi:CBS domain containing-hemolysin-like protein|uniref:CBS domain containing-hemolysin-like protein n=1 Tax=Williamsia limnetica TaxID=882452 RepID=A0A318S7H3_WILLI|nr:hemolysin family protein [Williamsia limnetica]PYE20714.1 CBS domain containing-hemolysin-like protein [Williamsia limnetica]